jgi:hypothetical protein
MAGMGTFIKIMPEGSKSLILLTKGLSSYPSKTEIKILTTQQRQQ